MRCVVGLLFCHDWIAMVEKAKPAWQAGLLNGIGGKVELEESFDKAMRREWTEETLGDMEVIPEWRHFLTLKDGGAVVAFYAARCDDFSVMEALPTFNDANERMKWVTVRKVVNGEVDIVPNLRWVIPLALDRSKPFARVAA